MSHPHVLIDVRAATDTISVIAIQGELSSLAESALMDAYLRACMPPSGKDANNGFRHAPTAIIFDFRQLKYMNSSGIGLLITFLIRMNRQKQRMLAYGLSEHYQRIFELTRLNEALGIFDTESEALAAAAGL